MTQFLNDKKEASGHNLSFECSIRLHRLMRLNPQDETIQQEFQRTINVLFEKFPDSMPYPKESFAEHGNSHS